MANYTVEGNKTVYCDRCHNMCSIPFQQTTCKCNHCGMTFFVEFYGAIVDKNGDYIY